MTGRIFCSNFPYSCTEDDLRALFVDFGAVQKIHVCSSREDGSPKGYGFVTMERAEDAQRAIQTLDGNDFQGRRIHVAEAKERTSK